MQKKNFKAVGIWILHLFCLVVLMGILWTTYRYSEQEFFREAIKGTDYEQTQNFSRLFSKSIGEVLQYAELQQKFETDGSLDLNKVVEKGTDADGNARKFTLQNALDFGQAVGIVFDENNHLVVKSEEGVESPSDSAGNSSEVAEIFTYDNYEDILQEETTQDSSDNSILLSLLYRLEEYYDFQQRLGNSSGSESNFLYRLVYVNNSGDTLISTNVEGVLNSFDLDNYGVYYWCDSKLNAQNSVISESLEKEINGVLEENSMLSEGNYELIAAVDASYPVKDAYQQECLSYQTYVSVIRLMIILGGLLVLGMLITFIALVLFDHEQLRGWDLWYGESILLIIGLMLFIIYWGVMEIRFAFQIRHILDLMTGIILIFLAYFPMFSCILSICRRIRRGTMISGMFVYRMLQYVGQNIQQRSKAGTGIRVLISKILFLVMDAVLTVLVVYHFDRQKYLPAGIILAAALLWNLGYIGISCRKENQQRMIFRRIEEMSEGKIGQKLDVGKLSSDNRNLAELVNALDDSLEKAVQTRTRSERMQTELIANVSHDLRTPLTSILTYVDLLRREPIPEGKAQEYLQVLQDKANRLKSLAEALMDASRATSGSLTINWSRMDMVQMLNQVLGEFLDRFETQSLEPVVHMIAPPAVIMADGKILWRIFDNLFSNVCKYAKPGTRVYIDLQETSHSLIFTLKNISARPLTQSAEDLTERFIRGDVARTTEGSGLGLSIVKNMTEQLHGKFELFIDGEYFRARLVYPKAEETQEG